MNQKMTSPYAPIRHQTTEWWLLAKELAILAPTDAEFESRRSQISKRFSQYKEKTLCKAFEVFRYDYDGKNAFNLFAFRQREMERWISFAFNYERKGLKIFDLGDDICNQFAHIDVMNCSLDQWIPPTDAFFLRFSVKLNVHVNDYRCIHYVDGVFVRIIGRGKPAERAIQFGFTVTTPNQSSSAIPGFLFGFNPAEQRMPIYEAIVTARARLLSNSADRELDSFYVGAVAESQQRDIYIAAQMVEDLAPLLVNSLYFIEQKSENAYLEKRRIHHPSKLSNRRMKTYGSSRNLSLVRWVRDIQSSACFDVLL